MGPLGQKRESVFNRRTVVDKEQCVDFGRTYLHERSNRSLYGVTNVRIEAFESILNAFDVCHL